MLNEYPQDFLDAIMTPSTSNRPSSDKIYRHTVIIPYVKGISEQFRRIGNRLNIRTIFKTTVRFKVTLRLAVYRQSISLGAKPLQTHDQYFLQLNLCGYSPYVTIFLTKGWVCCLQLLLALASRVTFGFESRGTHDHILLCQIRDSLNLEGQVPVFISLRNRVAQLYPQL
jgi:hypothetical protein